MPRPARSATELAAQKLRRAHEERTRGGRYGSAFAEMAAEPFEHAAAELLALPGNPDVGPGGEVVRTHSTPDAHMLAVAPSNEGVRYYVRNTLAEGATKVAEDASVRRTDLLTQASLNALALGIDAAESVGAENSIEKMIAHQMAVAHEMAMRFADRALSYEHNRAGDQVEATRCANTAARLMGTFQDAALCLQKLRTGGNQTVTVQHVNVAAGGQAMIGNLQTQGAKRKGGKRK